VKHWQGWQLKLKLAAVTTLIGYSICDHDTRSLQYCYNGAVVMLEGERLPCGGSQYFTHFYYIINKDRT